MIVRKLKKCKSCNLDKHIFSKGMCLSCYNKTKNYTLKKTKINKKSPKQKNREREYLKLRKEYLKNNKICEICKIAVATDMHHKKGRIGDNLFKDFLAVCRNCHTFVEENPKIAKELGYSDSRLKKEDDEYNN